MEACAVVLIFAILNGFRREAFSLTKEVDPVVIAGLFPIPGEDAQSDSGGGIWAILLGLGLFGGAIAALLPFIQQFLTR